MLTYSPLPEAERKARMTCASCCDRTAAQPQLQARTKLSSLRNQHHARKSTAESVCFFKVRENREKYYGAQFIKRLVASCSQEAGEKAGRG